MKKALILLLATMLVSAAAVAAQRERDPLSSSETNQLRDAKQEPEKRLKLYVEFAKQRMDELDKVTTDPRLATNRTSKMHDLIEDLGNIVEEMDDNVDMYAEGKWDIRKALQQVIQADTVFQQKLQSIKDAALTNAAAGETRKDYQFVLDDTSEAVKSSLESAQQALQQQEALAKQKQLRKPE